MDSMAIRLANLGTDMLTNLISCSIVYGFVTAHVTNLGTNTFTLQLGAPGQFRTA